MLYELEREKAKSEWFLESKGTERKEKRMHGEQQCCASTRQNILHIIRALATGGGSPVLPMRKLSLKDVK